MNNKARTLLGPSKGVRLQENTEKNIYSSKFHYRKVGQNHSINMISKSLGNSRSSSIWKWQYKIKISVMK
jgi:hypothetical protein